MLILNCASMILTTLASATGLVMSGQQRSRLRVAPTQTRRLPIHSTTVGDQYLSEHARALQCFCLLFHKLSTFFPRITRCCIARKSCAVFSAHCVQPSSFSLAALLLCSHGAQAGYTRVRETISNNSRVRQMARNTPVMAIN